MFPRVSISRMGGSSQFGFRGQTPSLLKTQLQTSLFPKQLGLDQVTEPAFSFTAMGSGRVKDKQRLFVNYVTLL